MLRKSPTVLPGISGVSCLMQYIMYCTWKGCVRHKCYTDIQLLFLSPFQCCQGLWAFRRDLKLNGTTGHLARQELAHHETGMEKMNGSYDSENRHRGTAKAW